MFVESIALSSLVRQHLLNLLLHVHCFCVVLVNMIFFPKHRHFAKTIRQKEDLEKNRIEKLKSWKSGLQICRDRGHLRPYPLHRGVTHDPVVLLCLNPRASESKAARFWVSKRCNFVFSWASVFLAIKTTAMQTKIWEAHILAKCNFHFSHCRLCLEAKILVLQKTNDAVCLVNAVCTLAQDAVDLLANLHNACLQQYQEDGTREPWYFPFPYEWILWWIMNLLAQSWHLSSSIYHLPWFSPTVLLTYMFKIATVRRLPKRASLKVCQNSSDMRFSSTPSSPKYDSGRK